jgi:hypothetical protein
MVQGLCNIIKGIMHILWLQITYIEDFFRRNS